MFTGIVTGKGEVVSLEKKAASAVLSLRAPSVSKGAETGDSISVNGACLTVTGIKGEVLSFDISHETLASTTLGALKAGERVNIEPSLRADGKLGGHFVTGHVDAVGKIRAKRRKGQMSVFEIEAPPEVSAYLVEKGSVAVDGISLTVVEVMREGFTVVVIPHTAQATTLGSKGAGGSVNLEADIIGKYVAKFLKGRAGGDSSLMSSLTKSGYV